MRAATALILSSCLLGSALDARAGQADPCGPPWRLVFGGALDDRIEAVTQDHAGNVIAVGYFQRFARHREFLAGRKLDRIRAQDRQ
jgi:hypothetical protein